MRSLAILIAVMLAACSPPAERAPVPAAPPPPQEAPAPPQGPFAATSRTATAITGDMTFTDAEISFMNGVLVRTTPFSTRSAYDRISIQEDDTFDAVAPGDDTRVVDLRSVDAQDLTGRSDGLCGAETPTYVALVHEIPIRMVSLIAFTGAEAPGPSAVNSSVCATFLYSAPDDALRD